jgi:catechol 2,3-dioxygenase-like lactoylglutathione lyase family enzyme
MTPKIDSITLGVTDLDQARQFHERGFGGAVSMEHQAPAVKLGPNSSRIHLRDWNDVALDAGVQPTSSGFRAFTLSYILESADQVDQVLSRVERHGGRISKPPKSAFWGYSAYVTDPSGYLWKIASSKGRPLLGRKQSAAVNGQAVTPKEVPITIGVADMKLAKQFYKDAIGLPVKKAFGNKFVMFEGQDGTSDLGMYKREALADDAAVAPQGSGFHGFSLTHTVRSPEEVDALLARASDAGGEVVMPGKEGDGGRRYFGYFADLDGNLWQVASRN